MLAKKFIIHKTLSTSIIQILIMFNAEYKDENNNELIYTIH